jgi:2-amino-4-hydroxy-6-hydroxymethyldihydropteridine diphosphokinase
LLPLSSIRSGGQNSTPLTGVYIGLGSNLGQFGYSPKALLERALDRLEEGGDKIIATSSFWQSDAWPADIGAPDFINAVARIQPLDTDPTALLQRLHKIEAEFGRHRDHANRWSARTLDLDLLDYNGLVSENNSVLILPHARMAERDFVLAPLAQVSLNWVHPISSKAAQELLSEIIEAGTGNNCRILID